MCFPLEGFWQREINERIRGDGGPRVAECFRFSAKGGGKKKEKDGGEKAANVMR